ncbi:fluoride efflux transporter CrcB [Bacillus sp. OK048]|uniref:fluoride efflux transporter CrcB n=1 Tax=Bacillus sp. OK048 TaxID=1882761 RepID=UPI000888FDF3|nr:fluoride efflux transporter CrcB [Bacillus sp. OK048]SDN40290.1 camphor resistance protein CrcB [Bacillus sp. OK048]
MNVLFVMVGGFLGAVSRFTLGEWIHYENGFPLGTFLINLIGCFLLGWFLTFISFHKNSKQEFTLFIGTGFIGSFTTFSTFSVETVLLFQNGHAIVGILYVLTSIFGGLFLAYFGYKIAVTNREEGETQ